ncbi:MAG TPA: hypothetical protein VFF39_11160 [Verrucomicrobiae bacterium]|nr:hypothetical protein [Verrucomicrobiae bacterium]
MKRGTLTGSVAGSAMLALALLRGSPSPTPAGLAEGSQVPNVVVSPSIELRTAGRGKKGPEDGPWKASQTHFAGILRNDECPSSSPHKHSRKTAGPKAAMHPHAWSIPPCENVAAMIAILPDPMQTNMRLQFDRTLEALQLAAEANGYVKDLSWLPWEAPGKIQYADYFSQQAALQHEQEKQQQPGLLLFRSNARATPVTLYMFLVSDSPTTGLNGQQFENAVDYIGQVCADRDCAQHTIAIVGPTFSGSLASLRRLTYNLPEQSFHAYSGTLASSCALQEQGLSTAPKSDCSSGLGPMIAQQAKNMPTTKKTEHPENLFIRSFVHDTESALQILTVWLEKTDRPIPMHGCRHDLAIISEAATAYGQTVPNPAEPKSPGGSTGQQVGSADQNCYVVFKYPRGISTLRNAYAGQEQNSKPGQASSNTALESLPFKLADRETNRSDEPPDFSKVQSPLSREAVLMSFASELRRRHITNAGIIGSDVLDVLFLAGFLRKACPNVRLFVLNADLLFERDLDNSPYIGTLTLTTYPLILRNLDWIQEGQHTKGPQQETQAQELPRRLPFGDQSQEGAYNAALWAIWCALPDAYRTGAAPRELRELQYPFQPPPEHDSNPSELPLWLTAIGYEGYWPVRLLKPDNSDHGGSRPEMRDEDFSSAWKAIALMLCSFSCWHIFCLLRNNWGHVWQHFRGLRKQLGFVAAFQALRNSMDDESQEFEARAFSLFGPGTGQRFFFINMANATLAAMLGMALVPVLRFSGERELGLQAIVWFMPFLMAVLLLICFFLRFRLWMPKDSVKLHPWAWISAIAVWGSAILIIGFWWRLHVDDPSHYGFFFAYRSVHLATGVSPLTPMIPLLAGFYCWALFESWRLKFDDKVRPRLREPDLCRTATLPGGDTEQVVAKSINKFFLRLDYVFALALIFALWLFSLHPPRPFHVFEDSKYVYLYEGLFCLLVLMMLASGFRLHQIWSDLKKLLAELDRSPIRKAFVRVREYSWSPIWHSAEKEREWTNVDRCLHLMQEIIVGTPKASEKFTTEVGKLEKLMEKLRHDKDPGEEIQKQIYTLSDWAMQDLNLYWHNDNGEEQPPCASQMQKLENFIALRYVAFLGDVLYQIRLLIIAVAVLFTLILLSLNIYSFEPHESLVWSFTAIFAVIGFLIVNVLWQVHRDNVLSSVTGSKANELGMDFYIRVVAFGVGPLLTLLTTHFPAIGRYLVSLLRPGLEAMK